MCHTFISLYAFALTRRFAPNFAVPPLIFPHQANNILDHEAEIMSRPKRTWFQSEKQKRALAEAVKVSCSSQLLA